jgi:hypothetical protein
MATIVTRAAKGTPLTHVEVDANFTNLNTDKVEAAAVVAKTAATGSAVIPTGTKPSAMDHPALATYALTPTQHPLRATMVQLGVRLAVVRQVMPFMKTLQLLRKT